MSRFGRGAAADGSVWLLLVVALLGTAYFGFRLHRLERSLLPISEGVPQKVEVTPRANLADIEKLTTTLFRQAAGSVVHITTLGLKTDPFELKVLEVPRGTGSGFVWDAQGDIVTNYHVVEGADSARVTLEDHSVWPATLVGTSRRHDLAVLRVSGAAARAKPLPLGTSHDLLVGQMAIAIGSPFGLDYTLSTGVISGLGREIPGATGLPIRGVIQTDAAINPGNSGGPLLDSAGRLIGVNTAILSPSGTSAGIGFAVPVDTIALIVPQLIRFGREVRPLLGVQFADDSVTRRIGLRGALVGTIAEGAPAARAGMHGTYVDAAGRLHLGDEVVAIDNVPIDGPRAVYAALDVKQPGDHVTVQVMRDGQSLAIPIVLGSNIDLPE